MVTNIRTIVIHLLLVVAVRASIDSIIEDVEEEYDREVADGVSGKAPRPAWDEYTVGNRTEKFVKYQLDMIISKEQFQSLVEGFSDDGSRKKRNAVVTSRLWPNRTIPYRIDDLFEYEHRYQILLAIQHVMRHTCVVFKPHEQETNYVMFIRIASGCSSPVGMMQYENQINLAVPNCMSKPIIAHELGHVLGLYHEHMRNDRDAHLRVHDVNITLGQAKQFRLMFKDEYEDYDKPYDYHSLMHYGKDYYGKKYKENNVTRRKITMEPTLPEFLDVIGEAPGLSFLDIKILNDMYNCADDCKQKECKKEGQFLGKNCECYCRGAPENAAVPCEHQASCHLPGDLDPDLHLVMKQTIPEEEIDLADNLPVPSGLSVKVEHRVLGIARCGGEFRQATCDNGEWDGEVTPPCVKERCKLDPNWYNQYFVSPSFKLDNRSGEQTEQTELPHNEMVDMYCNDVDIWVKLSCDNGSLVGQMIPCEGSNCTVRYELGSRFDYVLVGTALKSEEEVMHGDVVKAMCRVIPDEGELATNVTCDDGEWIGEAPADCPRDGALCPVIPDATVRSHETEAHRFQVTCLEGYDRVESLTRNKINIESFTCDKVGNWGPNTPVCQPATCSVPAVKDGYVRDRNQKHAPSGTFVASSDHVTLTCNRGHAPDKETVTCKLGKWGNGTFPVCTKVVCGSPPVFNAKISRKSKKVTYMYKAEVNVVRCKKKNHQLVGDRKLTCLKTGQWSGEARCQSYCKNGNEGWFNFTSMRASKPGKLHPAQRFDDCKEACKIQRGFLCLSVSFGLPPPKYKPECRLHKLDLHSSPAFLVEKTRWSAATRGCNNKRA